jgi:hypothetical protein
MLRGKWGMFRVAAAEGYIVHEGAGVEALPSVASRHSSRQERYGKVGFPFCAVVLKTNV